MTDVSGGLGGGLGGLVNSALSQVGDLVGGVSGAGAQVVAKTGDTLSSIAEAHGVPLSAVVEANPQVLHPDLVQPGQAITVPQAGAPSAPASPGGDVAQGQPAAAGGLVQGLGQVVAQTAAAAGAVLGQGSAAAPLGGALVGAPPQAPPPSAQAQAPTFVTVGQGLADFRVLAQAAPPLSPSLGATPGSPTLMQALVGIDPQLAQLLASALASPTLTTPATAPQLAKLETVLLSLGWAAVSLGLAKPGDVVLLLRTAMLQAARVPAEGLMLQLAADDGGRTGALPTRVLGPPSATPPGVDATGPQRLRDRSAGDGERRSPKAGHGRDRTPAESPQRAWIARALPCAIAVKARWGVPVAVTIAQGALASDWGRAAPGNDYFGVGDRPPTRAALPAPEARMPALRSASPAVFDDVDDAAEAFGAFVSATPVFARAFRAPDAKTFARRLGEAGFSRDPAHGERLAELIDTYDLNALDV